MYLRFFDSNAKEYKKLLRSILEVQDKIFITKQIENEILRNKVAVFLQSFSGYEKQINTVNITLPEHLQSGEDKDLNALNKEINEINDSIQNLKKKFEGLTADLIQVINRDEDDVSIVQTKIFQKAIQESEDQLNRARKRKEIGSPPGKKGDPLGDQISWEQLLDNIGSVTNLWIVTNDRDYFVEYKNTCYLNSLLYRDLIKINENINIYCFNKLSDALISYNKASSHKIETLPSPELLETIIKEEQRSNEIQEIRATQLSSSNPILPNFINHLGVLDDTHYFDNFKFAVSPNYGLQFPLHSFLTDTESTSKIACTKCGSHNTSPPKNKKINPLYRCLNCGKSFQV